MTFWEKLADHRDSIQAVSLAIGILVMIFGYAAARVKSYLGKQQQRRFLGRRLKPFYTEDEIFRATEIYIPTRCQNVDPAERDEPGMSHAFATSEPLTPFLIDRLQSGRADKYYLLLADTGMGKSTFMINFYLSYSKKWRRRYNISLVPLGHSKADEFIKKIDDKENTVLLLDAFDEDNKALPDYRPRLTELIEETASFQAVILTSRTQFFPSTAEEPGTTGILKHGTAKGEHEFKKLYLSPFSDGEVRLFLKRKFSPFQQAARRKAKAIVAACPNLQVRPMLLGHVETLVGDSKKYETVEDVYEAMIQGWIQRERVSNKKELWRFCRQVAIEIIVKQPTGAGFSVSLEELKEIARDHGIQLSEFELSGRSLLNRNSEGRIKFAHKSILEYLFAEDFKDSFEPNFFDRISFAAMLIERRVIRNIRQFVILRNPQGESVEFSAFLVVPESETLVYEGLKRAVAGGKLYRDFSSIHEVGTIEFRNSRLRIERASRIPNISASLREVAGPGEYGKSYIFEVFSEDIQCHEIERNVWWNIGIARASNAYFFDPIRSKMFAEILSTFLLPEAPVLRGVALKPDRASGLLKPHPAFWPDSISILRIENATSLVLPSLPRRTKDLTCNNCNLVDIGSLHNYKELEYLSLASNRIRDVSALATMVNLKQIDLDDNEIEDISPISKLKARISWARQRPPGRNPLSGRSRILPKDAW